MQSMLQLAIIPPLSYSATRGSFCKHCVWNVQGTVITHYITRLVVYNHYGLYGNLNLTTLNIQWNLTLWDQPFVL